MTDGLSWVTHSSNLLGKAKAATENEWLHKLKENKELLEIVKSLIQAFDKTKNLGSDNTHRENGEEWLKNLKTNAEVFKIVKNLTKTLNDNQKITALKKWITRDHTSFIECLKTEDEELLIEYGMTIKECSLKKALKPLIVDCPNIQLEGQIAGGLLSTVHLGCWKKDGTEQKVVIKKSRGRLPDKLLREAMIMTQFNHENVLKIIALSTGVPNIITEYMELGNLYSAVQPQKFSLLESLNILKDIANGMEHIHSKDYIHGDLAGRNIFLNSQKKCKIGDFGMSNYVGYTNGEHRGEKFQDCPGGPENFPPEVFTEGILSKAGDVWSMGIIIWITFHLLNSLGPNARILDMFVLRNGLVNCLNRPELCPSGLWMFTSQYMLNRDRNMRPNFSTIKEKIEATIQEYK